MSSPSLELRSNVSPQKSVTGDAAMLLSRSILLLGSLVLIGCTTPGPYAEVYGEKVARADSYEEEVLILGVDGKLDLTGTKRMTIEPGQRSVMLATVRADRRVQGVSVVVPLNAKACLRYYFVARHESMSAVNPWKLVLQNVEPIPECVAKYPDQAPVQAKTAG